jgi:hypothetical protein
MGQQLRVDPIRRELQGFTLAAPDQCEAVIANITAIFCAGLRPEANTTNS